MIRRQAAVLAALAVLGLLCAGAASAHPYHVSLAEAELNPESGALEVALSALPEELEEALSRRAGKPVVLDASPGVDGLLQEYLAERFRVLDAAGNPAPHRWAGKEVSHRAAWLYFEVLLGSGETETAPAASEDGWQLENRVLFELRPSQVNTVVLRVGEERRTLTFTREEPRHPLPVESKPEGGS